MQELFFKCLWFLSALQAVLEESDIELKVLPICAPTSTPIEKFTGLI
jgi:hypothetical protein